MSKRKSKPAATTNCTECGEAREIQAHPTKPARVVAYCDCNGRSRAVYEAQAAAAPPVEEVVDNGST